MGTQADEEDEEEEDEEEGGTEDEDVGEDEDEDEGEERCRGRNEDIKIRKSDVCHHLNHHHLPFSSSAPLGPPLDPDLDFDLDLDLVGAFRFTYFMFWRKVVFINLLRE